MKVFRTKTGLPCYALFFLLFLLGSPQLFAQPATSVKGVILDSQGEPIRGVSVIAKNSKTNFTLGTSSDSTGTFSFPHIAAGGPYSFIFTEVGYEEQRLSGYQIKSGTTLSLMVRMTSTAVALNPVVVVGYGTVRKSDLTGSVISLKAADFNKGGTNTSVAQLIQGRAPGVQVTQSSAAPGGGVSIRIRGSGSINAGNEPLYVIDGFPIDNSSPVVANGIGFNGNPPPQNPLNALNPSDIEFIEILKDASATAIYGSRGANGVVLITTRKGKDGRMNVEYTVTGSRATVLRKLNLLKTGEYALVMNDLAAARNATQPFSPAQIAALGVGTDWQDVIYRPAYTQDHNLSFSGGSGKTTFYTSFNFNNQDGVLINTNFKRYQGRLEFRTPGK